MKSPENLMDMYFMKLQALYDIENEVIESLPDMIEKASSSRLKKALDAHLEETKLQQDRIVEALGLIGSKQEKRKMEAIRGLSDDAAWLMKTVDNDDLRDIAIASSVDTVEHYEIANYETAIDMAEMLGEEQAVDLLNKTLAEEKEASELMETISGELMNELDETEETGSDEE